MRIEQNLNHLNPQAVLTRGYALVQTESGELVYSEKQLSIGQNVQVTLAEGKADAEIKRKGG
jgi:exodeoxyribonuclease VII large subunit